MFVCGQCSVIKHGFINEEPGPSNNLLNSEKFMYVKTCNFVFKNVEKLKYHIGCQVDKNDFMCIKCDQKFERWRDLASHLCRIHAMECDMPLCAHCRNYRTMYPKILKSHNQTNQKLKPFKCDVCNKRFNQISQLKNHAVIHIDKSIAEVPS